MASNGVPETRGFATKAIHAGQNPLQWNHGSLVTPLVMSTTFQQDSPGQHRGYDYGRSGNPTRDVLETCLAALEEGKHGITYSSGLGAVTGITSLLQKGDHLVAGDNLYHGTSNYIEKCLSNHGITYSLVDVTKVENVISAIQPNTKMIWLESPTNPLLKLGDIKAIADSLKSRRPDIILVIDNTFLTPYFQKPLELGADISMYSLTKYMNGHSDITMGAAITRRDDLAEKLRFFQNAVGIVPSPFDCSMVIRSLKTLELRMQQHMKNALAIAKFLESHPCVERVFHPYLPSHPQHELALKQTTGHSGMISFYLKGDTEKFLKALKVFTLADSLGGYESVIKLPYSMPPASLPEDVLIALGITDKLIRLSVGIETEQDVVADIKQALAACE
ncbi:putative cystathionine gamma-lyase 2 [Camponotus floridanus]|uniref:putative cystathionine gamma-lyase 2 n=1 Tax=Camponotus floridanus TaxID=104421 RepID=UPI000DC695A8|nr:putative cystathionine gamma-lyase 2 [Camponotus floridanus]